MTDPDLIRSDPVAPELAVPDLLVTRIAAVLETDLVEARIQIAVNAPRLLDRYLPRALGNVCECGSKRWRPRYRRESVPRWFCDHCGRDKPGVADRGRRAVGLVLSVFESLPHLSADDDEADNMPTPSRERGWRGVYGIPTEGES